ncbi:MAG: ABC transporter ATP-binding protein [Candidatus Omnitrophica bacterium]|nr:ABC transporter ATP-binding protein [Candidatus Omnitrophota bacterium]
MAEPVLAVRSLTKSFPIHWGWLRRETSRIEAVREVTWSLAKGETLGLVGESGCGKSTLAKLCVGLLAPTAGEVLVAGARLAGLRGGAARAARRMIQMVFQDPTGSLNPRMTVGEMLDEPLVIHRLAAGRAARRRRVAELLETVQLPAGFARRLPRELSGGERQRVGIARALAVEPAALILDEPVASLDVSVGAKILELLRALRARLGMAVLFISHDLGMVASLCERMAVMREGRLVELAPTQQLLAHPAHPYTQLLIRSSALDLDADTSRI